MLHDNEMINIEEDMILSPGHLTRRFTLHNRISHFRLGITSLGATVVSCKVNHGKDELIRNDCNDLHCSSNMEIASSDSNGRVAPGYEWQSHVLGLDTLLLATSNYHTSSITYQLTTDDQLLVIGKLRTLNQLAFLTPFYFNLNSDNDEASLEGHTLQVQAFSRTNGQSTELPICNHHESPSADYASYSGQPVRAPFDRHKEYVYVFSVPSSSFGQPHPVASVRPHDVCLVATLTFGAKLLQVRLHNNSPPSSARNLQSSNSSQISSTTSCAAPSCSSSSPSSSSSSSSSFSPSFSPFASLSSSSSSSSLSSAASKLIPRNSYGHCSSSGHFSSLFDPTSSSSEDTTIACASSSNHLPTSSNICSSSSSSSSSAFFSSSSSSSGASSGSSSSAGGITQICKLRVGITRFGVSLLPSQMNDFKCVYKFSY